METEIRASFDEQGYAPPVPIFSEKECRSILTLLQQDDRLSPMDWHKGWAVTSPEFYALAAHERIVEILTALIGDNVLLWGASLPVRPPGHPHPWHTDIETSSPTGRTVTVWIGLANTNAQSSLKVVPFSHRFGVTLQQVLQEKQKLRESVTDADVTSWAKERDSRSGVVSLDTTNGEAVFFDGRLWHGSHNLNRDKPRYALLLQYATPETPIRIPNPLRLVWPFEICQIPRPPCILVSGHAMNTENRIVPAPVANRDGVLPAISSRVHSLRLPLEQDPKVGWKPHPLFLGSTPDIRRMGCHASILDPGRQPHPPHQHKEEEILIVLDGEADLVLEDGEHRARRGTFAYYPAGFTHTIRNPSDAPVTYLMFKWKTDRKQQGAFLRHELVSISGDHPEMGTARNGFSMKRLFEGETACLRRLHAHLTSVEPAASYEPHVDAYDVGTSSWKERWKLWASAWDPTASSSTPPANLMG